MLLLDSQVALWVVDDNPRLGARARDLISSATFVHVSAATVWELTIKAMLGKLTVPRDLTAKFVQQGLTPLSITAEHAEALHDFPELARHDPFDRLLIAQAHQSGMPLLTTDHILLELSRDYVIDARQ